MTYFERKAFFENDTVFEELSNQFNFKVSIAWRGRGVTETSTNFYEFDQMLEIIEGSFKEGFIDSMVIKLNDGMELVIF